MELPRPLREAVEQLLHGIPASDLAAAAAALSQRYRAEIQPTLPDARRDTKLMFVHSDFLEVDISDANIVVTHTTLDEPLMGKLADKLKVCKPGTRIVTTIRWLPDVPEIQKTSRTFCQMDYGMVTAHAYVRR